MDVGALKSDSKSLRFFKVEKTMTTIKVALFIVALMAIASFALVYVNQHLMNRKVVLITLGCVAILTLIASIYIHGRFKVFPHDPEFFKKYPRLSDFHAKFGWKPFLNKQIEPDDILVEQNYVPYLYSEIETELVFTTLSKYLQHESPQVINIFYEFLKDHDKLRKIFKTVEKKHVPTLKHFVPQNLHNLLPTT